VDDGRGATTKIAVTKTSWRDQKSARISLMEYCVEGEGFINPYLSCRCSLVFFFFTLSSHFPREDLKWHELCCMERGEGERGD
jgi:hypothetical protein